MRVVRFTTDPMRTASSIAEELELLHGLEWEMPGLGLMWQFTTREGITFYTPAGASLEEVEERLSAKLEQFAGALEGEMIEDVA